MPLTIDAEQVSRFYRLLHGNNGAETEIRCIHPDRNSKNKPTFNYWGSLEEPQYAEALADHNQDGYGIYMVVNRPSQTAGKKRVHDQRKGVQDEDVEAVTALFVEMDDEAEYGENMEKLQEAALPPSILVRSSTEEKLHAYWLVADCPPELFTSLQAQLIALFGSDPTCKNLSRVMRIPGYWHTKREPIRSEILDDEGHTYTLAELCEAFGLDPELKLNDRAVAQLPDDWTPPDDIQERILAAAERHASKISPTGPGRHKTLTWFALACKENRLEQSVAENLASRVLTFLPAREGGEHVPFEEAVDVIEWVYTKASAGQPWVTRKKKANPVTIGGGGDPPDDDPFDEPPAAVDVTIHKNGYAIEKERRVGKNEIETYFEQLTNWTFTPTLTLIYPGGLRGERGTLAINGVRRHTIDLPSKAWSSRRDILEVVGGYGGVCFTNSASDVAKIRQFIDLAYHDLPSATGVQSYGLHLHSGKWLELFENATVGDFETPPLFYAGTPVDPGSVAHAAPRIGGNDEYEKARDAIPRLQSLTTRTTALAVTGYAVASAFAPRILAYQGGKMPFLYTTGERESGKSTFIEINLELVMGSKSGRFKLAPGMSTYQYDVAFSRANNFLAVLDEFKPHMIDDELLRKHHHLDTKWRGSGVAAKDHAYPLDAPLIVAGEGFTEDPASLSRGALYFFEKKDRGKLEHYNYLTQVPWFAFASYLHEQVRTLSEDAHRLRIGRAHDLSRQAAATLNPRLVFALRFIAYGLLVLQDDLGENYYSDQTILATLQQGAENTLAGGEEGITNFELFLQQLGSVASQAKDPESMFTPASTVGDAVIRISNAVEAVKDRYRERAAISNARMFRRLAHGAPFYVEGDMHKDFRGNVVRGLRINLASIPERCDASALDYLEQKLRGDRQ